MDDIYRRCHKYIYVSIRDGKLVEWDDVVNPDPQSHCATIFSRANEIDILDQCYRLQKYYAPSTTRDQIQSSLADCYFNGSLLRYERPHSTRPSNNVEIFKTWIELVLLVYPIERADFILNRRDFPIHRGEYEPNIAIFGPTRPLLFGVPPPLPVLSMATGAGFYDHLIPTVEDIIWITDSAHLTPTPWEDRTSRAVFRGSLTGPYLGWKPAAVVAEKPAVLQRLDIIKNTSHPDMDMGITKKYVRPRISHYGFWNGRIQNIRPYIKPKLTFMQQSAYKYIIHMEGHVASYRLGMELWTGCVILWVAPPIECYAPTSWLARRLKPYINYIPILEDGSDLIEKIEWCKSHDDQCRIMSERNMASWNEWCNRDALIHEWGNILAAI